MGYTASAILFGATIAVTNIIRAYCADEILRLQRSYNLIVGLLQHLQYKLCNSFSYISFVGDEGY